MQLQLVKDLCGGLLYYSDKLAVYDAYLQPDQVDLEARKNLDTNGVLDLIISKLLTP